ncbi:MAG TPA: LysR family transcriptional regulator [Limnobacter sp.]|nr:LysR family transcriptional regulator [Limnobacter sp.]
MGRLADLEVFVEVVKHRSFTDAADALGMNKSSVSKAVSRLEDRLGIKLLHRTTRKLSLSEEGMRLHERAQVALQAIVEAEQDVSRRQAQVKGTLRVLAPMSFGIARLARLLPGFMAQYPGLDMHLHLEDQMSEIVGEGFDVAIRIAELQDSSLVAYKVGEVSHIVVAARSYLDLYGAPERPDQLVRHRCVLYSYRERPNVWSFTDARGQQQDVTVHGGFTSNNSLAIREVLLGGGGVGLMPLFSVEEDLVAGRLMRLLPNYGCIQRGVYAMVPHRKNLSAKTKAFVTYLKSVGLVG